MTPQEKADELGLAEEVTTWAQLDRLIAALGEREARPRSEVWRRKGADLNEAERRLAAEDWERTAKVKIPITIYNDDPAEWVAIPAFGNYEASRDGEIRLATAHTNSRWGHGRGSLPSGYVFKPRIRDSNGVPYATVRLTKNGKRIDRGVHRLVCEVFHGPPPSKTHQAAHKDGNSLNNRASNLYWATPQENIDDRERHGRTMRGDGHYNAKLSAKDIPVIRKLWSGGGLSQHEIAQQFGVTNFTICDVVRRKSWKHIN